MGLVLGIDPGSVTTGYGIVGDFEGSLRCVAFGTFEGHPREGLAQRLLHIGQGLQNLLAKYEIKAVALEKTFFAKNADSAAKLGHARGVLMYECARAGVQIFEYNPTEVKSSVVGNGHAEKDQVQFVVRGMLRLPPPERLDVKFDMSDALALAIHHVRIDATRTKMREMEISR